LTEEIAMLSLPKLFLRICVALFAALFLPLASYAAEPGCRPEMAQGIPRIITASLAEKEIRITFIGHASFLIETPKNVRAVTDYNDYIRASIIPDIATMNKAHSTHYSRTPQQGITHLLPGWNPSSTNAVTSKIEHDLTLLDLRVRNVSTNIRGWGGGGTEFDGNSIFIFEFGDLCVVHLGHLHHLLEPGHLRAIGRADIVLVPVDSGFTLDIEGMMDVLKMLSPRVIIPMHFFGQQTLDRFIRLGSERYVIDRRDVPATTFSKESLPDKPTMVILPGR
jgi:L-ascorbate metabolism protein UlaG (beta-lactamase superfamily)